MTSSAPTVVSALAREVAAGNPGQPLVTFYDGATGERVELSAITFDNWVNKIANLLSDELMVEHGETIRVDLPTHWQTTVTLLGAWTAGLCLSLGEPATDAAISLVGPAALADASSVPGQPLACSLRPLGEAFLEELPLGWLDFAKEVPSQPDLLIAAPAAGPDDVAVEGIAQPFTHRELVERGLATAAELGLAAGGRLITDANPATETGLLTALVAPLVIGGSVVLAVNCDPARRAAIADQERVTAAMWQDA
jgi:uncharacterized protein (TIGR03089 family)